MLLCRCWAVSMILLIGVPAAAVSSVSRFGKEQPVSIEDFRPHPADRESYHEEWSHGVWLEDGGNIGIDFVISNIGMGDGNGAVRASYKAPNQKRIKCIQKFDDDEWSYGKKGAFYLQYGKNRLEGDLKGLRLTVRCKTLDLDLHFETLIPPAKPGGGVLRFGKKDGQYSMVFPSPRARVTGTARVKGQAIQIAGIGHASHSRTTMYPQDQIRRWFRFKQVDANFSIIMAELESEEDYNHSTHGWVLILDKEGRLLVSGKTNFSFDSYLQDQKSEEGYRVPRRVRFAAVDGPNQATGVLKMKEITSISDPTADLGMIRRAFVRRFTKPKSYRMSCQYDIKVKTPAGDRRFQGEGSYQFMHVNP